MSSALPAPGQAWTPVLDCEDQQVALRCEYGLFWVFSSTGKLCAEKVREQNEMGEKGRKSRIKGGLFKQERPSGSLGTSKGGENAAVLAVTFSFSSREVCYLTML